MTDIPRIRKLQPLRRVKDDDTNTNFESVEHALNNSVELLEVKLLNDGSKRAFIGVRETLVEGVPTWELVFFYPTSQSPTLDKYGGNLAEYGTVQITELTES